MRTTGRAGPAIAFYPLMKLSCRRALLMLSVILTSLSCGRNATEVPPSSGLRAMAKDELDAVRHLNSTGSDRCRPETFSLFIYKYFDASEFYGVQVNFLNGPPVVGRTYTFEFDDSLAPTNGDS